MDNPLISIKIKEDSTLVFCKSAYLLLLFLMLVCFSIDKSVSLILGIEKLFMELNT